MEKIKIITDSTADLPSYIVEKYNIEVLPLLVYFGEEEYYDGIGINLHTVFERIRNDEDIFPTTAQVNPERFYECYKKYLDEGYKIISIHISSKMSGTYQSACIAKDMLNTEDIIVIDSQNVTVGLGLLVIKACNLKEQGFNSKEIEDKIIEIIPHVESVIVFGTLENLIKGGRISKTVGTVGNVLDIKPVISVKDGKMTFVDKVRGKKKSIRYVENYIKKLGIQDNELSILVDVENKDILDNLRMELSNKNMNFIESQVGCVVGVHAGPGTCGVFFIEKYQNSKKRAG